MNCKYQESILKCQACCAFPIHAFIIFHAIIILYFTDASEQNNYLPILFNQWTQDPIEKAILVNIQDPCPEGTSNENITYEYISYGGICECYYDPPSQSSTESTTESPTSSQPDYGFGVGNRILNEQQNCYLIQCSKNYSIKKVKRFEIKSQNVNIFFSKKDQKNEIKYKICTSRIKDYSFLKKIPLERKCGSGEKYCSWQTENQNFDFDDGYCIPQNRECYQNGVHSPFLQQNIQQLPLIGFKFTYIEKNENRNTQNSNVVDLAKIIEKGLLDMNNITYPKEYSNELISQYVFSNIYMPKIMFKCRAQLFEALSNLIDISKSYKLALASLLIFISSTVIFVYYWCYKYFNRNNQDKKYSKINNLIFTLKTLLLISSLILNILNLKGHFLAIDQILNIFEDESCGFNDEIEQDQKTQNVKVFIYICIVHTSIVILLDAELHCLIQRLINFIIYLVKCITKKKQIPSQISTEQTSMKNKYKNEDSEVVQIEIQEIIIQGCQINKNFQDKKENKYEIEKKEEQFKETETNTKSNQQKINQHKNVFYEETKTCNGETKTCNGEN